MKKYNMKPIIDLMDDSINRLKNLISNEHQMKCNNCGQMIDLRDLSQVFAHEDCMVVPVDYGNIKDIPYSGSVKIGTPDFNIKNKNTINLN
jgi:hypothetical protein